MPMQGSRTVSPANENILTRRYASSSGNGAGCCLVDSPLGPFRTHDAGNKVTQAKTLRCWPQMMHASTAGRQEWGFEQVSVSPTSSRSSAVGDGSNPRIGRSMTLGLPFRAPRANCTGHSLGLLRCGFMAILYSLTSAHGNTRQPSFASAAATGCSATTGSAGAGRFLQSFNSWVEHHEPFTLAFVGKAGTLYKPAEKIKS